MAPARSRMRLVASLAALAAATGIVGCALIGDIGDLPFPSDGAVSDETSDGPLADGADASNGDGPAGPEGSMDAPVDVTTQDGNCPGSLTACGTACENLMQDPGNCGRCGHGCQGGMCASGTCQPFALLPDGGIFGTPAGVLVHGNAVYWVNNGPDGTILTVSVDGGPFAAVVPVLDAGQGVDLAMNDTTVYFTIGNSVLSSPLDGGAITTLASGLGGPDAVVLHATSVYFTDYSNPGSVLQVPLAGGTVTTLAPNQSNPGGLALNDTTAYWTASGAGTIMSATLDGGAPTNVAPAVAPFGVALDSTSVYWTTASGVFSIPLNGGSVTTLSSSENNASGIAVDATGVYLVNYGSMMGSTDGTVKMIPLDGGPEVTLATSQENPQAIAIDSTSVYWTNNYFFGQVMKVAKP
ncbi:MAG TPA: hypothetical protein VF765_15475 [Polyangiaceae bacterium]